MSVMTEGRRAATRTLTPGMTATIGLATYATAVAAGELFGLNADTGAGEFEVEHHLVMGLLALMGVALAVWAGHRGWNGPPQRLARTSLVLAVVAAATFVVFWAGWTNIFGAVAVGAAAEYRRRMGSWTWSAAIALVTGSLAFAAGTVTCLFG